MDTTTLQRVCGSSGCGMSEPTGRYRVHYQSLIGWQAEDFGSYTTAVRHAKKLKASRQAQSVRVLKEYESDDRFSADFRPVWP